MVVCTGAGCYDSAITGVALVTFAPVLYLGCVFVSKGFGMLKPCLLKKLSLCLVVCSRKGGDGGEEDEE